MKRLIAAISALVIFLGYAFFYESKQETKQEKPTVAILQLMTHPALDSIHHGIVDALKENGYVPGKTIKLDYQNAEGDQSSLKTMSDRFKNENSAVMIGIATPAAQSLANVANGKTPVVMGAISDPIGAGLVKNIKHPGANITGVIHKEPVKQQVKLIKTIMPNVKVIGGLHTSSDDSSTAEFKEFKQLAEKEGIKVKDYTITSTNDIDQVSSTMASEVRLYSNGQHRCFRLFDRRQEHRRKKNSGLSFSHDHDQARRHCHRQRQPVRIGQTDRADGCGNSRWQKSWQHGASLCQTRTNIHQFEAR